MVQIISTWLFQPNKHKLRKFLSGDRDGPSEGRIQVWIIQQPLILGLVLIECGDIIKKEFAGLAVKAVRDDGIWSGSEPRSSAATETSPCRLKRSQRKEASVNQQEIEKDFIKRKCVKLLMLNKSPHFSLLPPQALASKKKKKRERRRDPEVCHINGARRDEGEQRSRDDMLGWVFKAW